MKQGFGFENVGRFLLLLLLVSSVAAGRKTSVFADLEAENDRIEEIRRTTLADTRFTDVPFVGEARLESRPSRQFPSNTNMTSLYFPFYDNVAATCDSAINGHCNRWDWRNHTWGADSPAPPSGLVPPPTQPSWARNLTYVPNFVCYKDFLQFYGATWTQFNDPVPLGNIVIRVSITLTGTFVCEEPDTSFSISFQGSPLTPAPLIFNATDYPQDCSCASCPVNMTYTTGSYAPLSFPWYHYDGVNHISFVVYNGSLCLNAMEVNLFYQQEYPTLNTWYPNSGPKDGGTEITFYVDYYQSDKRYACTFPTAQVWATMKTNGIGTCMTPTVATEGPVQILFVVVDNLGVTTTIGRYVFTFYSQLGITSLDPTSARPGDNVTVRGVNIHAYRELNFYCRIGGANTINWVTGSSLVCKVPLGLTPGQSLDVDISLNNQNWSNKTSLFILSPIPDKPWYQVMPGILYLAGGVVGVVLLLIIMIACIVRCCRAPKNEDGSSQPLLRNSFGPKSPSATNYDIEVISEFEKVDLAQLKLGKRIGKGSFGEVFIGTYLGTDVAVKKLPANKITPEFMAEFAREASLMRSLRHPNVVQFLGATMDEPDICIVTEYMSKGSLYHLLHDPNVAISWEMVRKIALDAAKGMAYLHLRTPAIIHRDLKSHNLLVDENWKVKVCDFGLSKIAIDLQSTMTACGTPCWTAPEILRNARYTTKADVFSYGIVLWELVTREEPFAGMPAFQVIFAVGNKGTRLPLPQVCPPELIKLIVSCWQEDPALRPPFQDIITYLERITFAPATP